MKRRQDSWGDLQADLLGDWGSPPAVPAAAAVTAPSLVTVPAGRSSGAVYRQPSDRGPRHGRYPELNITETAARYGMSKSQLSRLLNGDNRPGITNLRILAQILDKPVEEVMRMYEQKSKRTKRKKSQRR